MNQCNCLEHKEVVDTLRKQNSELIAKVERYKSALMLIAFDVVSPSSIKEDYIDEYYSNIARQALEPNDVL